MNVIKTAIPDVLIFEPKVFGDERGFFFESFNYRILRKQLAVKYLLCKIITRNLAKEY